MKKVIFKYTIIALCLSGCNDDFLNRGSLTQLAEGNFWKTERDAQLGINAIYDVLQDRVIYSGNLNGTAGLPQFDSFADNTFNNYKFEGPGNFVEGRLDPSADYFNAFWSSCYKGIGRANLALENIEKMPANSISTESKNKLMGQVYFLRALFYINLATYFEEVPLILQTQSLENAYVPKNSYEEIKASIVADLTKAIATLPNSYPEAQYGYATKGAALSLLARFQLYNKNYAEVVNLTSQVMALGYKLHPNYQELFTEAGEFSQEVVFSVRFIQGPSSNGETFSATFEGIPKVNLQPMPNLVDSYYCTDGLPITKSPLYNAQNKKVNRDPRLGASVYFQGDIFVVYLNRAFQGNTATKFGLKKYIRNNRLADGTGPGAPGGQDFYVIRYADVLLMRAEALAELGQLGEVNSLINQVRARVKMPTVEAIEGSSLSKQRLIEIIKQERRVELAFEGLRFFDVKRWGQVGQAYQAAIADRVPSYAPTYRGKKSEIFPIPQRELDANKSLVQNPAWN
jgi:starch-binding outer membrane protein, SusD/RagB family